MKDEVELTIRVEIIDGRYVLFQIGNQWSLYDILEWINANNQD